MRIIGRQGIVTQWLAESGTTFDVRAPFLGVLYPGPAWILACSFFPLDHVLPLRGLPGPRPRLARRRAARRRAARATFFRLVVPQVAPSLWAGAFLVFVLAVCAYPVPSLLDTPVLIQRIFFTFSQRDQIEGALLALPLLLTSLVLMALVRHADALFPPATPDVRARRRPPRVARSGRCPPRSRCSWPPARRSTASSPRSSRTGCCGPARRRRSSRCSTACGRRSGTASSSRASGSWRSSSARGRSRTGSPEAASRLVENLLFATLALPPLVLGVGVVLAWKTLANVPVLRFVYWNGILMVVLAYVGRFLPVDRARAAERIRRDRPRDRGGRASSRATDRSAAQSGSCSRCSFPPSASERCSRTCSV